MSTKVSNQPDGSPCTVVYCIVPRIAAAGDTIQLVGLGVFPIPQEDGPRRLVAVTVDRVAAGDAVLEDEVEGGGEAVPLVGLSTAAVALRHHQALVVFESAGAAQAKDETQQEKQEHQNCKRRHDSLQERFIDF